MVASVTFINPVTELNRFGYFAAERRNGLVLSVLLDMLYTLHWGTKPRFRAI